MGSNLNLPLNDRLKHRKNGLSQKIGLIRLGRNILMVFLREQVSHALQILEQPRL